MTITIFLADDHAIIRDGLRSLLEAYADLQVIGEANNGREAVTRIARTCPDVAILDIAMPELNGLEAARQTRAVCPQAHVIILSMHATTEHIFQALEIGVRGYLLKVSAGSEVVEAVRAVQAGRRYLSDKVLDRVIDSSVNHYQQSSGEAKGRLARLSPREHEVLQLVVEGKSSVEIADVLNLSPKTVETYRSHLMQKLDINDLPSLVKFAIRQGLTPLD